MGMMNSIVENEQLLTFLVDHEMLLSCVAFISFMCGIVVACLLAAAGGGTRSGRWIFYILSCLFFVSVGCWSAIEHKCVAVEYKAVGEPKVYKLESLAISDEVSGKVGGFLVVYGEVDTKPIYRFIYKTKSGGYKLKDVPADEETTTVYYESGTPRVERLKMQKFERENVYCFSRKVKEGEMLASGRELQRWVIYVPEGAILRDFNL